MAVRARPDRGVVDVDPLPYQRLTQRGTVCVAAERADVARPQSQRRTPAQRRRDLPAKQPGMAGDTDLRALAAPSRQRRQAIDVVYGILTDADDIESRIHLRAYAVRASRSAPL